MASLQKTILIVDDEPDVRKFFQSVLEDAGFDVEIACDGIEGLERVKNKKPDLISLDLVMPKKSGIKLFYELRKNREWSKIPVLIVTAHAKDEFGKTDFKDLMEGKTISGPQTYLEKPIKPNSYVNTIKQILKIPIEEVVEKEKSQDELQKELKNLINGADKSKLQEALDLLKKKMQE